jgi:hypothetical protein
MPPPSFQSRISEENKRKSGLTNVDFLKGEIEDILLPDNSVDVIINQRGEVVQVLTGKLVVPRKP